MDVVAGLDELEEVKHALCTEEAFLATAAAEDGVPEGVEKGESKEDVAVGGGDVGIFEVADQHFHSVLLAKELLIALAAVGQVGDDTQAQLLDLEGVLFPVEELQQVVHHALLADLDVS